jgi:hypothetical protein
MIVGRSGQDGDLLGSSAIDARSTAMYCSLVFEREDIANPN